MHAGAQRLLQGRGSQRDAQADQDQRVAQTDKRGWEEGMHKKTTERWDKALDKAIEAGYEEGWKAGWIEGRNAPLRGEYIRRPVQPLQLSQKDLEEREMLKVRLFGEDEEDEHEARRLRGKRPKRT